MNEVLGKYSCEKQDNINKQKALLIELNQILFRDVKIKDEFLSKVTLGFIKETKTGSILLKEGYDFIIKNKDLFLSIDFLIFETELKKEETKNKEILKIIKNNDFIKFISILKEKVLKSELSKKINETTEEYRGKIDSLIEEKKMIEDGNQKLSQKVTQKEEIIKDYTELFENYGININNRRELIESLEDYKKIEEIINFLKENGTLKKGDDLVKTIEKLEISTDALNKFIEHLYKIKVLIPTNNSKKATLNNSVLKALGLEKIIEIKLENNGNLNFSEQTAEVIKEEEIKNKTISNYKFQQIEENNKNLRGKVENLFEQLKKEDEQKNEEIDQRQKIGSHQLQIIETQGTMLENKDEQIKELQKLLNEKQKENEELEKKIKEVNDTIIKIKTT